MKAPPRTADPRIGLALLVSKLREWAKYYEEAKTNAQAAKEEACAQRARLREGDEGERPLGLLLLRYLSAAEVFGMIQGELEQLAEMALQPGEGQGDSASGRRRPLSRTHAKQSIHRILKLLLVGLVSFVEKQLEADRLSLLTYRRDKPTDLFFEIGEEIADCIRAESSQRMVALEGAVTNLRALAESFLRHFPEE